MRFLNLGCSTPLITYLILIQLSTSCAGPVPSSRRRGGSNTVVSRLTNYVNIQRPVRNQPEYKQQSSEDEILIATTENSLALAEEIVNTEKSPTELLLEINNFSGLSVSDSVKTEIEEVTESILVVTEQNQDLVDPSIDPAAEPVTADIIEEISLSKVSSEAPPVTTPEASLVTTQEAPPVTTPQVPPATTPQAPLVTTPQAPPVTTPPAPLVKASPTTTSETPIVDPLFYPALSVPIAPPESIPTTVAASLSTVPPDPVIPAMIFVRKTTEKKVEISSTPPSTDLPYFSPVKLPKLPTNTAPSGGKKNKIPSVSTSAPQVSYKVPVKYRPVTSPNPPVISPKSPTTSSTKPPTTSSTKPPTTSSKPPLQTSYNPPFTSFSPPKTSYNPPETSYNPHFTPYSPLETPFNPPEISYNPPETLYNYNPPETSYNPPFTSFSPPEAPYNSPEISYNPPETSYNPPITSYKVSYNPSETVYNPPKISNNPSVTSYNSPNSVNPYLGEEQDYVPPTFTGPAALPINIHYTSGEEGNFALSRPFGTKKLDFPHISNTEENFGHQW